MTINIGGNSSDSPSPVEGAVTVSNFPVSYPDTQVHTDLTELNSTQVEALAQIDNIVASLAGSGQINLTSGTITNLQTAFTTANEGIRTDLSTIADDLNNILSELMQKIEAGEDVGLTPDAINTLATAIATLFHYPTDYPDATTHTKLDSILSTLAILPTASPLTDTQLRATPVPTTVSGVSTAANQATEITALGTLHTDLTNVETKQDTGNTSLASVDTKLSSQATATNQTSANTKLDTLHTDLVTIEGKQDTGNTSLASIDTKLTTQATATNQTTANTKLDTIHTDLVAVEGKQDTGNTSLASVDTKLSSQATASNQTSANTKLDTLHTDLVTVEGYVDGIEGLLAGILRISQASLDVTGLSANVLNAELFPSTIISTYKCLALQVTGTWVGRVDFQGSNDGTNWVAAVGYTPGARTDSGVNNSTSNGLFIIPLDFKYVRAYLQAYTSGTVTGTATLLTSNSHIRGVGASVQGNVGSGSTDSGSPVKVAGIFNTTQPTVTTGQRVDVQSSARGAQIVATGVDTFAVGAVTPVGSAIPANAFATGIRGGSDILRMTASIGVTSDAGAGDSTQGVALCALTDTSATGVTRLRTPNTFKTATATASGDTAVWTPTSGKKFRLMGYSIEVTANASQTVGGLLEIILRDLTTATAHALSVFVPGAALATFGANVSTYFVPLGNGQLSAAANNVLNVNLSAALLTGEVRVKAIGTEE